ncbi:PREDICTED: glycerate kinase-like [Dufourea novaeangliae]|uniref:glycerate kinase-like n=1 Tax=Dufourea novaeangliae TaxID=178035 RepID=UPI000767028C|nr:PREDICTED: glycerate kinase-like [Dufourea novaeangliae]
MENNWSFKLFHFSKVLLQSNLLHSIKFTSENMSTDPKILEESKSILKDIYFAGVKAVSPKQLIVDRVKVKDGVLQVGDQSFQLKENVYLVGFGKAVMGMSIVLEHMLGNRLKKGTVSIPSAATNEIWESEDKSYFPKLGTSVVQYREGSVNNQPDNRSLESTHDIIDLVESLTENDTLIVLISGGGSALLYMPRPIIDTDDKLLLCKRLQHAGADIKELNIVRMKLSMVKGGGLARMAFPASIITLILSDIVGDPIDLIASGPTVYNSKTSKQSIAILKKYELYDKVEGDLKKAIMAKETFKDKPLLTGKRKKKEFKHVKNIILGNNEVAVKAAALEALCKKLVPIILRTDVTGNVHNVSLAYVHVTSLICLALEKKLAKGEFFEKVRDIPVLSLPPTKVDEIYNLLENVSGEGIVLIGGGEPTVIVNGNGKGGRNQELALYFSLDWLAKIKSNPHFAEYDVIMLSAGTDGQDGPTDATGAFGYPAIGPIIHDLYTKVKLATSKMIHNLQMKKEAMNKKEEERRKLEQLRPQEVCKLHELSGFVIKGKKESQSEKHVCTETEKEIKEDEENEMEDVLPLIYRTMEVERMLPKNTLNDNDTYNLYSRFKKGSDLFKTGFTGTNVMDLHFIYIKKRKCDCRIDFLGKEITENVLDDHDIHIDALTIEKYKRMHMPLLFDWGSYLRGSLFIATDEADHLNIKIIDDNLSEPCCRRNRKFPEKNLLKDKNLPI